MARLAGLRAPRLRGSAAWLATLAALAAGLIFVTFGAGHFANHGAEVADFRGYQVPFASLAVWAVGVVELGGGVALLLGLFVRGAAVALAVDLVGVIATAGPRRGRLLQPRAGPAAAGGHGLPRLGGAGCTVPRRCPQAPIANSPPCRRGSV